MNSVVIPLLIVGFFVAFMLLEGLLHWVLERSGRIGKRLTRQQSAFAIAAICALGLVVTLWLVMRND